MSEALLIAHAGAEKIGLEQLRLIGTPEGTHTHKPIAHATIVDKLTESLAFRHISVMSQEFACTPDGMRMFGVLTLTTAFEGCRFALGLRNSHDKSLRFSMTVGAKVTVCDNLLFRGDYTPIFKKHSKSLDIDDAIAVGLEKAQRNFEPLQRQVETWRATTITDDQAKLKIYEAFVEEKLAVPKRLAKEVHRLYFDPAFEEFMPRNQFSLQNAFTSAFRQELEPIPLYRATVNLAQFFN